MISFDNLTETGRTCLFLIPEPLKPDVMDAIKASGFPCESVSFKDLCSTKDPYDVKPQYREAVNITRRNFEQAGYQNTTCIGGIKTNLDPNELFRKCLEFFGDTIDPDYEQQQLEAEAESRQMYETCYKEWLDEGQLPVETEE